MSESKEEVIQRVTLQAWSKMFSNEGVNHMLNDVIYRGMLWGYDNPIIAEQFSVSFTDKDDLLNYGREQMMLVLQGKSNFARMVKDLFDCAACYNAQYIKETVNALS